MIRLSTVQRRLLGLLLMLVLVVGACSGEQDVPSTDGNSLETETGAESVEDAAGDGERDNGTDGAGGGNDLSTWCGYVSDVLASSAFSLDGLFQLSPDELEARLTANAEVTAGGLAASTDDIGPWVQIIDESMQAAVVAGQEDNWDILAMSENPIFFDQMTLNNLMIASEEVDFYNTESCGIPTNLSGQNGDAMAETDALADPDTEATAAGGEAQAAAGEEAEVAGGEETGPVDDGEELAQGDRTLDNAQPIDPANATSTGTAVAGGVGTSFDLPGGSGSELIDWLVAEMGIPKASFPDSTWDCLAAEIDQAYPDGVEPGPVDAELQTLVTASIAGCGFGEA